ncbi:MAG: hypothetical protein J2P26_01765 [Nocardiopsaceae bacterium]|nr:hypothetical protein [Nocardiopsaceae bacterium]
MAEGARVIVQLATLPADGPAGGFFNDQGPVPWQPPLPCPARETLSGLGGIEPGRC